MFHALVRWAAPVLVFTAEEVWGTRFPGRESVHLLEWPTISAAIDPALAAKWVALRQLRTDVTEAIEPLRREKVIGSSLEAEVWVPTQAPDVDLAEIFISSTVHPGELRVAKTDNHKCGRCWRHLPEVAENGDLCDRCEEVVGA
jgi:isoleucyl-tRNA synthetase